MTINKLWIGLYVIFPPGIPPLICNTTCQACPFKMEEKEVKSDNFTWKITKPVNFEAENWEYLIEFDT